MAELLRFNIKKKTGVYFDKNQKLLNKFYIENNSARHKNELRGYLWYLEKLKKKNFIKFSSKSNYFQIPLINGKKFNFWEKFLDEKKKNFRNCKAL